MTENIHDFKHNFNEPTKQHQDKEKTQSKVLKFFGKSQDCAVYLVNVINSTKLTAQIPESKLNMFNSTFLYGMADVVKEHKGKIVKSIEDALLFYFDESDDDYMRNVLKCGLGMIEKRDVINDALHEKNIPSINYRMSSDFGKVMIGYSAASAAEDIFGSVVNMCSKINPLANSNGMVIGNDFHMIIKSSQDFKFSRIKKKSSAGMISKYPVYEVKQA